MHRRVSVVNAIDGIEHGGLHQGGDAGGEERSCLRGEHRGEHVLVPIADFISARAGQAGESHQCQACGNEALNFVGFTFHGLVFLCCPWCFVWFSVGCSRTGLAERIRFRQPHPAPPPRRKSHSGGFPAECIAVNPLALDRPKFTPETFCPLRAPMGAGLAVVCVQPARDTRRAGYVPGPRAVSW